MNCTHTPRTAQLTAHLSLNPQQQLKIINQKAAGNGSLLILDPAEFKKKLRLNPQQQL
jgi:hypothetical protein